MSKENVRRRIKNRRKKSFTEKAESDEYFINNSEVVIDFFFLIKMFKNCHAKKIKVSYFIYMRLTLNIRNYFLNSFFNNLLSFTGRVIYT